MTFYDDLQDVSEYTNDTEARLPRIGWRNGTKQAKKPGFFYIRADDLLDAPSADHFKAEEVYDGEQGYTAEQAHIAIIGYRQQAFRSVDSGVTEWLREWEPGARIFTEILCQVQGIDELLVWTAKGMTGKAITGKGGIIAQARKLADEAGRAAKKRLGTCAFWLPIAQARTAAGQLVWEDTGYGSLVSPPAIQWPAGEDRAAALWVGKAAYEENLAILREYRDSGWFDQRRGTQPVQPQAPIVSPWADETDDDMPF